MNKPSEDEVKRIARKIISKAGPVVFIGSPAKKARHDRVVQARAEFTARYMLERGWGDDPVKLSIKQLLEIHELPFWKDPLRELN